MNSVYNVLIIITYLLLRKNAMRAHQFNIVHLIIIYVQQLMIKDVHNVIQVITIIVRHRPAIDVNQYKTVLIIN